jgi:heptaprenylglyceryl phosphate synthase|tara:strand:- start:1172 stop:1345 length:174 start_codon:yes stop_codon:yes gene_type:complete
MKIADLVIAEISKEENKNKIVEALNKNINIPIINEQTEEKYISAMVDTFISVLKKVL